MRISCLPPLLLLLLLVACLLPAVAFAEAARTPYINYEGKPSATLTELSEAPTVDGAMEDGEWGEALRLTGFRCQRRYLEPRDVTAYLAYTRERLYLAVVSGVPPSGPQGEARMRDANTISDSGIELWIDPNAQTRGNPGADTRYYQLMFTPFGSIRDMQLDTGGSPTTGWDPDLEYAYAVDEETHVWTAEISIPWADLGLEGSPVGRDIGMILARNFKRPWRQATAMNWTGEPYVQVLSYPTMRLRKEEPVMQVASLGDYLNGKIAITASIYNPGPARQVKVHFRADSDTMPTREETVTVDLPAHGTGHYRTQVGGFFHPADTHHYTLEMTDAATGALYFRQPKVPFTFVEEPYWIINDGPQPERALGIRYYPSLHRVYLRTEPLYLGEDFAALREATVSVLDAAGKAVIPAQTLSWEGAKGDQPVELGELADGVYTVRALFAGYPDPIERQFRQKTYPWVTAKAGVTTEVYPPFAPIQVENRRLDVVMRRYLTGGLGLWDSVEARGQGRDDQYRELLARPMTFVLDGQTRATGAGAYTSVEPHQALYAGSASLGGLQLSTRTITEYDGCTKVILTVDPGATPVAVQSLDLDIPLKNSEVSLFHVSTTGLRQNPAGAIPEGQGVIWDTTQFPDGEWYGGFLPYVWLGTESRGFSWFADNDKGWTIDYDIKTSTYKPAFSIHREGDVLSLRVHFVQKPDTIATPRQIVFGIMATPGKPMREDWRAFGRSDTQHFTFHMNAAYGLPSRYCAAYPADHDWSIFDASFAQRKGEKVDTDAVVEAWVARHGEKWRSLAKMGVDRARNVGNNYYSVYFDEFHSTAQQEDTVVYYAEWTGRENSRIDEPVVEGTQLPSAATGAIVPSYQDYATYYAAEWLRRGVGIYFDNSFPKRAYDTVMTAAYVLPDGNVQPSASMWNHREYLKRIWVLHQQLRLPETPQMMSIHMTNTHIVPYMVWNEVNLDLEYLKGPYPAQAKYAADMLRAETLGLQSGNIPNAIASAGARKDTITEEQYEFARRTRWAALLVHEIRPGIAIYSQPQPLDDFGYGLPDCEVYNYWDRDSPVTVSDAQCKTLLLKRNGELLLLAVTWNPEPATVTIGLDLAALGVSPAAAVDPESDTALAWKDGKLTLNLIGYGVSFARLR